MYRPSREAASESKTMRIVAQVSDNNLSEDDDTPEPTTLCIACGLVCICRDNLVDVFCSCHQPPVGATTENQSSEDDF